MWLAYQRQCVVNYSSAQQAEVEYQIGNSHPKNPPIKHTRIFASGVVVFVFIHVFLSFHAPNRPRRSATADNALTVLRTGAVPVAVVPAPEPVPVVLVGFFTGAAVVAEPRGRL